MKSILLFFLILSGFCCADAKTEEFYSPKKKIKVQISRVNGNADTLINNGEKYFRYKLVFNDQSGKYLYDTTFDDAFEFNKMSRPLSTKEIFDDILWSPEEDFAILQEENWPSAPSSPARVAINLNPKRNWKTASFDMDIVFWWNKDEVIGNYYNDCSFYVVQFDGESGSEKEVIKGQSPTGYQIEEIENKRAIIKKMADNCATDEYTKSFIPACFEFDGKVIKTVKCKVPPP